MKDLTEGKESKQIFKFAVPLLIGNVFQQLYNIVDSAVVGNYIGKDALAAVGASFPIVFALISFIIGIATGGTIVISQYFGAKDYKSVKRAIGTIYIFIFAASLIISILGIIFSEDIFRLLRLPEELMPLAKTYLTIFLGGLVVFFGFNATSAILRGLGDSKTPLYFLIIASLLNVLFDLLFVPVFGWGVAGVALATIFSQGIAFLAAIIYLNRRHELIRISVLNLNFDRDIFKKSLRIGLPTGFQNTFVALGMMAVMGIVNTFGTEVIAAYSVGQRIDSFASMFAMNFGLALSIFVGQNIGANKMERVRAGLFATLKMAGAVTLTITAVIFLGSHTLMGFFTSDAEVIAIGSDYLSIVSIFYLVLTFMFIIGGVMRGAGDTLIPMFKTFVSLWIVRIPLAWYLSGEIGVIGIWWAIPIGWSIGLIFSFLYYMTGRWKKKAVVKHEPEAL